MSSPCWARPRPWPGRLTIGPGWDRCWPRWPMDSGRRETSTAPWRRASRPSRSRSSSARAPYRSKPAIAWGRYTLTIGDFGRAAELLRRNVEAADWEPGTPSTLVRLHSQAWLALDLERARGLRRGPAPRGGGAPPRHAGRPRGRTDRGPHAASVTCTSPKGTWSPPSGCSNRAWPSVVPPATGTVCD